MNYFDYIPKENIKEHNSNWSQTPDYLYRIILTGDSGSGKTNSSLNLITQEPHSDKTYLYTKDPDKEKYQFVINKRESTGLKHSNDFKKNL